MSGSEVLFLQEKARTLLGGFLMFAQGITVKNMCCCWNEHMGVFSSVLAVCLPSQSWVCLEAQDELCEHPSP